MEGILKNQMGLPEVKNTTCEMKISLDELNNSLDTTEEKINELEDRVIEIIHCGGKSRGKN